MLTIVHSVLKRKEILIQAQPHLLFEALDPCTSGRRISKITLLRQVELCPTEALAWIQPSIFFPTISTWLNLRHVEKVMRSHLDLVHLPQLHFHPFILSSLLNGLFPKIDPFKHIQ